jgi:hypothetical protein
MTLPSFLHRHFWNCRVGELDTELHKGAIIETLLEHGDLEAWKWMMKTYKEKEIIPVLRRSRSISPKSKSFWAVFFHIDLPEAHVRQGTPWWDRRGTEENC